MSPTNAVAPDQLRRAGREVSAESHPGTIRAYYPFWDTQYRPFLLLAAAAIPPERFDFKPRPEMLTAHQIMVHIAETEIGWIDGAVEGKPVKDWVVQHEDPKQGWVTVVDLPDHPALHAALEQAHKSTQRWLDKPSSELSRVVTWRGAADVERRATLHWVLDHLQEHEIHHRAQLNLYLRLMGIEPPSI
ncbi:MAG: DinB family protein [Candidatus Eiseniibacteriota bacterium]